MFKYNFGINGWFAQCSLSKTILGTRRNCLQWLLDYYVQKVGLRGSRQPWTGQWDLKESIKSIFHRTSFMNSSSSIPTQINPKELHHEFHQKKVVQIFKNFPQNAIPVKHLLTICLLFHLILNKHVKWSEKKRNST